MLALPSNERPQTAAYATEDDPFTQPQVDLARQLLEQAGVQTASYTVYSSDTTNFAPVARKLVNARADIVVLGTLLEDFKAFVADLASVTRILPAFDMTLPHKLTLRGFFLARFGRGGECADLLDFVSDFHEDIYDQYVRVSSARARTTMAPPAWKFAPTVRPGIHPQPPHQTAQSP